MNKEEMKRRLEENVEPKYNKQRNLEEIKSNLTFTNEKEIMESMVQEKQQQTQKYRWMTLFFVLLGCFLLIGTNWITYSMSSRSNYQNENINNYAIEYLKINFESYDIYPKISLFIEDKYEFSLYEGQKQNEKKYVYFVENLNEKNKNSLLINVYNNGNEMITINKESSKKYVIGELTIKNLTQGSQLTIDIYENDNFLEQRIITL